MKRILIVGAGGHAQVIADALACCIRAGADWQLIGFLDNNPELAGREVLGFKILGTAQQLAQLEHEAVIVGIGDNVRRAHVFNNLKEHSETLLSIIHPRAVVASHVVIGEGSVVFANAVINTGAIIGANVIVNTGATIDHHASVGQHAHIAPGAHLGGTVTIGEGAFIGIGGSIVSNRVIGAWTTVGAGAAVIHDLPARVIAVGVPARIIKTLPETD